MNIRTVIGKSDAVASSCWEVVESVPGSQQLGYIAQSLFSVLEKVQEVCNVENDRKLQNILENLELQLAQAKDLVKRSSRLPMMYMLIRGYPISSSLKDSCVSLSIAVTGLYSHLSTYQGSVITNLKNEVEHLGAELKNSSFPVDESQISLFTATRKIASRIYTKAITPEEGKRALRSLLESVVGKEKCKEQWSAVSKQLFEDMFVARGKKDLVEEHYFQQIVNALGDNPHPDSIPPEFLCPISLEVMKEPMILVETGVTYDKKSIDTWLNVYGHNTCPVSQKELRNAHCVENRFAKVLIHDWFRGHPREDEVSLQQGRRTRSIGSFENPDQLNGPMCMFSSSLARLPPRVTHLRPNLNTAYSVSGSDVMLPPSNNLAPNFTSESSAGGAPSPEPCQPGPSRAYPAQANPLYAHGHTSMEDQAEEVPLQFGVTPCGQYRDSLRATMRTPPMDVLRGMKEAIKNGDISRMAGLLSEGWSPDHADERGRTCLHIAAACGSTPMVHFLLANGCNVDAETHADKATPLFMAAATGRLETVRVLLQHKANIMISNQAGLTPLHIAADQGHSAIIQVLLNHAERIGLRMYVALTTRTGWTALHHATRCGSQECISELVSYPHMRDKTCNVGYTALHVSVDCGHISATVALLDAEVNVNRQSRDGWSPLHIAQDKNHIQIARILLSRGADPDIAGKGGMTALHKAVLQDNMEFVKLLVVEGRASLKLKTKPVGGVRGKKAIKIAKEKSHRKLYTFLLKASMKKMFLVGP